MVTSILVCFPGHLETLIPELLMVFCSEMFVDWVKHAFITKFNDIQPEVRIGVYSMHTCMHIHVHTDVLTYTQLMTDSVLMVIHRYTKSIDLFWLKTWPQVDTKM